MARFLIPVALLGGLIGTVSAADVDRAAVVRFNTVCIRCHEGECSGRLSFDSGAVAAINHVRRYLPAASAPEVGDLFAVLRHTKEHCAFYPVAAERPADGIWQAAALDRWREPGGTAYFVPLGRLSPGRHRLAMFFAGRAEGALRVESEKFVTLLEAPLARESGCELELVVAEGSAYFLLLNTASPLVRMKLGD